MDFKFDKTAHISKMKPFADKLVNHFVAKGIVFSPTDGENENVIFTHKNKIVKIAHHCFYRYSGISTIYKERGENFLESVKVTDEMFMGVFMKSYLDSHFLNLN